MFVVATVVLNLAVLYQKSKNIVTTVTVKTNLDTLTIENSTQRLRTRRRRMKRTGRRRREAPW